MCTWDTVRDGHSEKTGPPGCLSWALTPFLYTQEAGIHYHLKHFRPNRQTTVLNLVCILPSNVLCTYGNISALAGGRGGRDISYGTLLHFRILNHMNGPNIKINIKGTLQAEGKWSQMEAWISGRKEEK